MAGVPNAVKSDSSAGDLLAATDDDELTRPRRAVAYSAGEREFSQHVQQHLYRLLRGDENELVLMRAYNTPRHELGFFLPAGVRRDHVRPAVAQGIVTAVLRFLDPFAPGGPVAQQLVDGRLVEVQTFPTQHPHIVVERTDQYDAATRDLIRTEWKVVRLQNQRRSTLINRVLDIGNLAIEISRFVGVG